MFALSVFAWHVCCVYFVWVISLLGLLFLCLCDMLSAFALSLIECDVFCVCSFLLWRRFYCVCSFFVSMRCLLCLLFLCLSVMFNVLGLSLFECDVFCVCSFFDWVWCSLVCVKCWMNFMLIDLCAVLTEFHVHCLEWGVDWVRCFPFLC